jgi:2'-5' RNA ligase
VRLFLAFKPDRPGEALLGKRLMDVQTAVGDLAPVLRWTPASNVHITLHFLGEIPPARVDHVADALGRTLDEDPFEITLGGAGVFPPAGAPRVVWLDVVKGIEPLQRVHAELGRRLASAGCEIESRPLSPHVTIARVPDRERARVKALRDRLKTADASPIAWVAERVILFRSDLSGSVPRYEGMQDIELTRTSGIGPMNVS